MSVGANPRSFSAHVRMRSVVKLHRLGGQVVQFLQEYLPGRAKITWTFHDLFLFDFATKLADDIDDGKVLRALRSKLGPEKDGRTPYGQVRSVG